MVCHNDGVGVAFEMVLALNVDADTEHLHRKSGRFSQASTESLVTFASVKKRQNQQVVAEARMINEKSDELAETQWHEMLTPGRTGA